MSRELHALQGLPAGIVKGIVELGKGIVNNPVETVSNVAKGVGKGLLTTGKHIVNPGSFVHDAQNTTYVETLMNDIGNVAMVFGGGALGATKAAGAATKAAKVAEIAGDTATAAAKMAEAERYMSIAQKARVAAAPYRTAGRKLVTEPLLGAVEKTEQAAAAGQQVGALTQAAATAGNKLIRGREVRSMAINKIKEASAAREMARRSPLVGVTAAAIKRLKELHPELTPEQLDNLVGEELKFSAEGLGIADDALAAAQTAADPLGGQARLELAPTRLRSDFSGALADPELSSLLDTAKGLYGDYKAAHATSEVPVDTGAFRPSPRAEVQADRAWALSRRSDELRSDAEYLRHQLDDLQMSRDAIGVEGGITQLGVEGPQPNLAAVKGPIGPWGGDIPAKRPTTLTDARMAGSRDARITEMKRQIKALDAKAAQADELAARSARKAIEHSERDLSVDRVPAEYQPLVKQVLRARAGIYENVEKGLWSSDYAGLVDKGITETLNETFRRMQAGDLPAPQHWSDLTQTEVDQLGHGNSRLGNSMRKPGQFMEAGFRKERTLGLRDQAGPSAVFGAADSRASSLLAQAHAVAQEASTNGLVMDMMKQGYIKQWDPTMPLPEGYVPAAPQGILRGPITDAFGGNPTGEIAQLLDPRNNYIMPKAVAGQLSKFASGSTGILDQFFAPIDKFTDPWRTAILPLSPRWLFNNTFGGLMVNMVNGSAFDLQAWGDAFRQLRKTTLKVGDDLELSVPFGGVDARIIDNGVGQLMGDTGLTGEARGIGEKIPGVRRVVKWAQDMNQATDNFYRTMTFSHELRKVGSELKLHTPDGDMLNPDAIFDKTLRGEEFSPVERKAVETAVDRATKAMVDYGNMSPFERTVMRRVIPFYTWQKGIAKLAISLPLDHPLRFAALEQISNHLGGFSREERENFPDYMIPMVSVGGLNISTRGVNPFQDALALFTKDGIASSLHPLLNVAGRYVLGAPEGPADGRTVGPIGFAEDKVSLPGMLKDLVTALPQARLEESIRNQEGAVQSPGQALLSFAGLTTRTDEQLANAQARLAEGRKTAFESQVRRQAFDSLLARGATLESLRGKPTSLLVRSGGLSVPQFAGRLLPPPKKAPAGIEYEG